MLEMRLGLSLLERINMESRIETLSECYVKRNLWMPFVAALPILVNLLRDGRRYTRRMAATLLGEPAKYGESYQEAIMK